MKQLICLVLAAIMIFALVACNATQESDIDELKQRITQLEDKNKELEDELHNQKLKYEDKLTQQERKYDDKLSEKDKKIEDIQKDLDILQQKLENLTGKKIEFTSKAPEVYVFTLSARSIEFFGGTVSDSDGYREDYEDFVNYVRNDVKTEYDYDFYLLNPRDLVEGTTYNYSIRTIREDSSDEEVKGITDIFIEEYFNVGNEVLGIPPRNEGVFGGMPPCSISWVLYLKPLPKDYKKYPLSHISLEFGQYEARHNDIVHDYNYFNIYIDSKCIGTCYYDAYVYVSQTWIENYFIKNLI